MRLINAETLEDKLGSSDEDGLSIAAMIIDTLHEDCRNSMDYTEKDEKLFEVIINSFNNQISNKK